LIYFDKLVYAECELPLHITARSILKQKMNKNAYITRLVFFLIRFAHLELILT